jgi:hypothetical protein
VLAKARDREQLRRLVKSGVRFHLCGGNSSMREVGAFTEIDELLPHRCASARLESLATGRSVLLPAGTESRPLERPCEAIESPEQTRPPKVKLGMPAETPNLAL